MALQLYESLASPVVQDLSLVPVVFQAYGLIMTRPEIHALVRRLNTIHEISVRRAREAQQGAGSHG